MVVGAPWADAQDDDAPETRPVAVVSFSGYAELKRDLEYLGARSGNPDLASLLEQLLSRFTKRHGLAGVDQDRPWGASLSMTADGSRFPTLVFLPVSDMAKLVEALGAALGGTVDAGDDMYEIKSNAKIYYATRKGTWAYVSERKDVLKNLPSDPLLQLRGLYKQYDLALNVNLQNVPAALRDMAAGLVKQDLDGLGQVTAGLNIDRAANRTYLDLQLTALPGRDFVKQPAADSQQPKSSQFPGIFAPDAIFSFLLDWRFGDQDEKLAKAWLDRFRDEAPDAIDREQRLDDEQKTKAKKLAGKLLAIVDKTIEKEGRINFGLVVTGAKSEDEFGDVIGEAVQEAFPNRIHETIIGAGQVTVVAGGLTADGAELEDATMQLASMIAEAAGEEPPKRNINKHKGRRFHAFSVMAPQTMRAELPLRTFRNLLGNPLKIVLAFGDDTYYAAVGEKGADAIKRAIDRSTEQHAEKPPLMASLALGATWKLALSQRARRPNSKAEKMAASMTKEGKDHLQFSVGPVDNGLRCRIEGEDGANKLLGLILSSIVRGIDRIAGAEGE